MPGGGEAVSRPGGDGLGVCPPSATTAALLIPHAMPPTSLPVRPRLPGYKGGSSLAARSPGLAAEAGTSQILPHNNSSAANLTSNLEVGG